MRRPASVFAVAVIAATLASPCQARTNPGAAEKRPVTAALAPAYCSANHDVGRLGLGIGNDGTHGNLSVGWRDYDCFTLEPLLQGEYPLGSHTRYYWGGALWIGAVVGNDTLVSTGADGWSSSGNEFHPEAPESGGSMIYRSTLDPEAATFEGAISQQDYIAVFRDTCRLCSGVSNDLLDGRAHRPINLEVTQRSFAWSFPSADDFILVDYSIRNIGTVPINDLFIGLYMDQDIHDLADQVGGGAQDDISGLWSGSRTVASAPGCEASLDLEMPWSADNDGDLNQPSPIYETVPHVAGIRLLNFGGSNPQTTFNWWVSNGDPSYDWGPMRRANARDFGTGGFGTPVGDRNKYFVLSNGDRDYDQVMTGTISDLDTIWMPPPTSAPYISGGLDTRYLVSTGSLTLEPGQTCPLTLAFVAGQNLHTSAENFLHLPEDPAAYLAGLDFEDYLNNGVWAGWVYDNPGVDTDSDAYAGQFVVCGDDTLWYAGDGVPDWRATTAPVAPTLWVEPRDHALYVRWNGRPCENLVDWASREKRFEGYRMYLSTAGGPGSFAAVGEYDIEDYYRYFWDPDRSAWEMSVNRLSLSEARCRYAPSGCDDPNWHPLDFTRQAPYVMPDHTDSILYFSPILANASQFGLETPFVKRFPGAPRPPYDLPSQVPDDSLDYYLTPDGYFKYYEYENLIGNLVAGQTYWVAVTSFDWGSILGDAGSTESPIWTAALSAVPTGPCCNGIVGNVSCDAEESISLADVVVLIDFLFIDLVPPCCLAEADINQSGGADPTETDLSIADAAILIDFLYITGPSLELPACQ